MGDRMCQPRTPTSSPLPMAFILFPMHFNKSALQQDHEIPAEIEQFPLTQGCEATPPSWWDISENSSR